MLQASKQHSKVGHLLAVRELFRVCLSATVPSWARVCVILIAEQGLTVLGFLH